MSDQPYMPPKSSFDKIASSEPPAVPLSEPIPIGGWLILVAFGLIVTPFRLVYMLFANHWPIFRDGHWERLTHESGSGYHVLWAPFITFEIAGNICLLVLVAITLALFFKKSRKTPRFAIGMYAFGPVFMLVDQVLGNFIPAIANSADGSHMADLSRSIVAAAIWIPYFLVSKRVKNTFTR